MCKYMCRDIAGANVVEFVAIFALHGHLFDLRSQNEAIFNLKQRLQSSA